MTKLDLKLAERLICHDKPLWDYRCPMGTSCDWNVFMLRSVRAAHGWTHGDNRALQALWFSGSANYRLNRSSRWEPDSDPLLLIECEQ